MIETGDHLHHPAIDSRCSANWTTPFADSSSDKNCAKAAIRLKLPSSIARKEVQVHAEVGLASGQNQPCVFQTSSPRLKIAVQKYLVGRSMYTLCLSPSPPYPLFHAKHCNAMWNFPG
jgi:hypothetical protein